VSSSVHIVYDYFIYSLSLISIWKALKNDLYKDYFDNLHTLLRVALLKYRVHVFGNTGESLDIFLLFYQKSLFSNLVEK